MGSLSIELDSELLVQAEEVCAEMGITVEDAVVMFLQETLLQGRGSLLRCRRTPIISIHRRSNC